jgi:hypothetical protein
MWKWFGGGGTASPAKAADDKRFTLQHLQHLHAVLLREKSASPVTPASDAALIDAIKQVSELMVWGDKFNDRFFECVGGPAGGGGWGESCACCTCRAGRWRSAGQPLRAVLPRWCRHHGCLPA